MTRRLAMICTALVALGVTVAAQQGAVFKDATSEASFRMARAAVGHGEGLVEGLKSLILKGKSLVAVDEGNPIAATVEIRILLPDHYLRIDTAGTSRMVTGYAGKTLLTAMEDGTQRSAPPAEMHETLHKVEEARLARLLLGTTTYVSPYYFINFRSAGAVQGMTGSLGSAGSMTSLSASEANLIEGAGRDGFFVRLFLRPNGIPVRLEYRAAKGRMNLITLDDRRDVGGLQFPFHITTNDGKRDVDDLRLEQVLVNPPLTPGDFTTKR